MIQLPIPAADSIVSGDSPVKSALHTSRAPGSPFIHSTNCPKLVSYAWRGLTSAPRGLNGHASSTTRTLGRAGVLRIAVVSSGSNTISMNVPIMCWMCVARSAVSTSVTVQRDGSAPIL